MSENLPRNHWSRTPLPAELIQLLKMLAGKHGFYPDDIHLLIYAMAQQAYPDEVENLSEFLGTAWMDTREPPAT